MSDAKHQRNQDRGGPSQLNLVNSSRLQSLRNKAATVDDTNQQINIPGKQSAATQEAAEIARLRRLIDQRLAEILGQLPTGKQSSLFKIRFGMVPDELRQLPIKQIAAILKIQTTLR